ncbi:hypothetical protein OS493_008101 [Desmophyllum pertusum]|uniref:Uncharacterized protein n=1 Tax=Desmophyllum pertusum TaxID=174260 RepID=A0A9W9YFH6_9CNID|nr:hypothetical protein OS493_008101 [Desmophyllum pertusum]
MDFVGRCFLVLSLLLVAGANIFVPKGKRVLARMPDSTYSHGNVTEKKETTFLITFDSGDQIEYSYEDKTAVLYDTTPAWVSLGDHVLAMSMMAKGIEQQYLVGFVSGDFCQGRDKDRYEITLDESHNVKNYTLDELRKLPFFSSISQVGARVFARGNDNFYHRGFVKGTSYHGNTLYIHVQLNQSGSISHQASDERAIILDVIPLYSHVHATQRVIGYYPGYSSYLPGMLVRRNAGCWKSAYHVRFDMGGQREQDFNEIRIIPPPVKFLFFP